MEFFFANCKDIKFVCIVMRLLVQGRGTVWDCVQKYCSIHLRLIEAKEDELQDNFIWGMSLDEAKTIVLKG